MPNETSHRPTIQVDVMPDGAEIVHYDESDIPFYLKEGLLSMYKNYHARAHWHEDIELLLIYDGQMEYDVDGQTVLLMPGDIIAVNSRHIHCGYSSLHQESSMLCLLFRPQLFLTSGPLQRQYLQPVTQSPVSYYIFRSGTQEAAMITDIMNALYRRKKAPDDYYHLYVIQALTRLWELLFAAFRAENTDIPSDSSLKLQKDMISFIQLHYPQTLSLEAIAATANVSKSTCCRIFRRYTGESPIDYLNRYRIEAAAALLKSTDYKITDVGSICGFNSMSYFSKCFLRYHGCTPGQYRKQFMSACTPSETVIRKS